MARRAYYLRLASSQAALGAILYSALLFLTLALLRHEQKISAMLAFLVMALAALLTSLFLLLRFRPQLRKEANPSLLQVTKENWEYGRWALPSALLMWIPWNIFYTLVASFSGMSSAGQLRALLNFALPVAQTYSAMSLLLLPHAATKLENRNAGKVSLRITLLFVGCGVLYWTIVVLFKADFLKLLYAGQYDSVARYIPIIAIASILWGSAQGPAIAMRANKTPMLVFVMYLVSGIIAVAVGIPATIHFGLAGATVAMLLASASAWIAGIIGLRGLHTRLTVASQAA